MMEYWLRFAIAQNTPSWSQSQAKLIAKHVTEHYPFWRVMDIESHGKRFILVIHDPTCEEMFRVYCWLDIEYRLEFRQASLVMMAIFHPLSLRARRETA